MSIVYGVAYQFVRDQLNGLHDLEADVLRVALFNTLASLDRATANLYSSLTNECVGSGYTAGGVTTTATVSYSVGSLPVVDFSDITWSSLDLGGTTPAQAVRGAVLYNVTRSGKVIAVIDFGANFALASQDLTIQWPALPNAYFQGFA